MTDDRFTYKPGEKVYVKGWVRWTHNGVNPDLALPRPGDDRRVHARTTRAATSSPAGTAELTDQGGFDLEVAAARERQPRHGDVHVRDARPDAIAHPISIEEFRTPAYAVDARRRRRGTRRAPADPRREHRDDARPRSTTPAAGCRGADIRWDATARATAVYRRPAGTSSRSSRPATRSAHGYALPRPTTTRSVDAPTRPARCRARRRRRVDLRHRRAARRAAPSVLARRRHGHRRRSDDHPRQLAPDPGPPERVLRRPAAAARHAPTCSRRSSPTSTATPVAGVPIDVAIEGVLGSERWRDDAKVIDTQRCRLDERGRARWRARSRARTTATAYTAIARGSPTRAAARTSRSSTSRGGRCDDDARPRDRPRQARATGPATSRSSRSGRRSCRRRRCVTFARHGRDRAAARRADPARRRSSSCRSSPRSSRTSTCVVDRWAQAPQHLRSGSTLPLPERREREHRPARSTSTARGSAMRTRLDSPAGRAGRGRDVRGRACERDGKPVADAEVALMVVDEAVLALVRARRHADPLAPFYRHDRRRHLRSTSTLGAGHRPRRRARRRSPAFTRFKLDEASGTALGTGSGYGMRRRPRRG